MNQRRWISNVNCSQSSLRVLPGWQSWKQRNNLKTSLVVKSAQWLKQSGEAKVTVQNTWFEVPGPLLTISVFIPYSHNLFQIRPLPWLPREMAKSRGDCGTQQDWVIEVNAEVSKLFSEESSCYLLANNFSSLGYQSNWCGSPFRLSSKEFAAPSQLCPQNLIKASGLVLLTRLPHFPLKSNFLGSTGQFWNLARIRFSGHPLKKGMARYQD